MLHVYYGTDAHLVADAAAKAMAAFSRQAHAATAYHLRADNPDIDALLVHLNTPDLFSPVRLALVERVDAFPADAQKTLIAAVKRAGIAGRDDALLCVSAATDETQRTKQERALASAIALAALADVEKRLDVPKSLAAWATKVAATKGFTLEPEAAARLVAGKNATGDVVQELEKLALYAMPSGTGAPAVVREADVMALCRTGGTEDAFRLIGAIGNRDRKETYGILLRLFAAGEEPLQVLGLLAYAARMMLALSELSERPVRPDDVSAVVGLAPWQLTQYRTAARTFTREELERLFGLIVSIDRKAKTGDGDPRLLLERLAFSVA